MSIYGSSRTERRNLAAMARFRSRGGRSRHRCLKGGKIVYDGRFVVDCTIDLTPAGAHLRVLGSAPLPRRSSWSSRAAPSCKAIAPLAHRPRHQAQQPVRGSSGLKAYLKKFAL
jgi:hypothetical protein